MTLLELTKHEAGILVYGNQILVDNWADCRDDVIPNTFIGFPVRFPKPEGTIEAAVKTARRVDHIIDEMPDAKSAEIDWDYNGDIPRIYSREDDEPGMVYELPDGGKLIVPDYWN